MGNDAFWTEHGEIIGLWSGLFAIYAVHKNQNKH